MKDILALIGVVTIGVSILMFGCMFIEYLIDKCRIAVYTYKRKHRFDKPPTAECYCKDCVHRFPDDTCNRVRDIFVEDDFFCKDAVPYKHDPDKKKHK